MRPQNNVQIYMHKHNPAMIKIQKLFFFLVLSLATFVYLKLRPQQDKPINEYSHPSKNLLHKGLSAALTYGFI